MFSADAKGFWWFTLSFAFALTLPILIQDGMFQDAVLYCAVSNNMSVGFGNFWFPQYSTLNLEGIPSFHEQPPLFFGLMSLLYQWFGSSIYVERIFVFVLMILHIILIKKFWTHSFAVSEKYRSLSWLPVFFWILIPVCFWSFRHNMIENLMGIFILSSVWFSLRSMDKQKPWTSLLLSGFFIFLATFSKGVPGLFPLVVPVLYSVTFGRIKWPRAILYSLILFLIPAFLYGILLWFPEPRESLSIYFFERLLGRVSDMHTTGNRFKTLVDFLMDIIPHLILIVPTVFFFRKSFKNKFSEVSKEVFFYFLLGLSGILPLMTTMVQKNWYMVPALPFIALSFAYLMAPMVSDWMEKIGTKTSRYLSLGFVTLFISVLIFTLLQFGKISREEATLTDVYKIGTVVPRFSTLTVPKSQYNPYNFVLQGFLVRHFHISISPYENYEYYLTLKDEKVRIPPDYKKLDLGLKKYTLYKR